jgi:hypothetical protein
MGRSGTSAITRVLSLCGGSLPKRLLGANEGNPTGHWEPLDGLNLNEGFLQRYGSNWYDPRLPQPGESAFDLPEGRAFVDRIADWLEDYLDESLLAIKEPRITALTGFWFAAARRLGFRIAVVVAVRHPDEVAASLAVRDRVPLELSNTLWLKYNGLAERSSRGVPRVFVEFPNLLMDWRSEVDRVTKALSIDLCSVRDHEIEAFLSPDLRRQRAPCAARDPDTSSPIQSAYAMLSMASRDMEFSESAVENLVAVHMSSSEAHTAVEQFARGFSPGLRRRFV